MGYEGRYILWFLALAFPFAVYCLDRQSSLFSLVLPGIALGVSAAFLLAIQPGVSVYDALARLVALPAVCFLISWLAVLPLRYRWSHHGP